MATNWHWALLDYVHQRGGGSCYGGNASTSSPPTACIQLMLVWRAITLPQKCCSMFVKLQGLRRGHSPIVSIPRYPSRHFTGWRASVDVQFVTFSLSCLIIVHTCLALEQTLKSNETQISVAWGLHAEVSSRVCTATDTPDQQYVSGKIVMAGFRALQDTLLQLTERRQNSKKYMI